ncbi:MAG: hypothetical protein HOP18_06220 [Deltaproteobacteria bacterium]|nr:hypothetical protein [Deltaproteobacteria bacterium]
MRKMSTIILSGLVFVHLFAGAGLAQKRSVAEEILDILRAENKISEEKYQELMNRAKAETEAREAGVEAYRRDPVKTIKQDRSLDWLNRFSFSGDLRTRGEGFYQDGGPSGNARTRFRYRLRFGAQMKISDEVLAGVRLVSGDANDPISTNETLTNLFTRKPVAIDHAYIMLTPKETIGLGDFAWNPITLYAGKFTNTFFKPRAVMVSELIFDDDLSPEGLAETFTLYEGSEGLLRRFQLNAAQWVVRENSRSGDAWMMGGQAVVALQPLASTRLTLAFGDYFFSKTDSIAQARAGNSALKITNSVILKDGTVVKGGRSLTPGTGDKDFRDFLGGFNIINASMQLDFNTGYAQWPFSLVADFAHNTDAKNGRDIAVWAGASLGATRNPGDWAFSLAWARTETDSVLSTFSYSDFGRDGGTNNQGPFVRVDYMLFPRLTITAKNHFVSFIDRPKGQSNATLNRFQLDAQVTF